MPKLIEATYTVGERAKVTVEGDDMTEVQLRAELDLAKLGFDVQTYTHPATQAPQLLAFNPNFGWTPIIVTILRDGTEAAQAEKIRSRETALNHYLQCRSEGRW